MTLRFLQQRYESLVSLKENAEEEVNRIRSKNGELQSIILNYQKQIQNLEFKNESFEEEIRKIKLTNSNIQVERDISKQSEKRLQDENKRLREDSSRLMKLLESVQNIGNML